MCGIFGYYNHRVPRNRREILDCLLTGLRRLEYRGYDSAGICVDAQPAATHIKDAPTCNGHANGHANGGEASGPGGPCCGCIAFWLFAPGVLRHAVKQLYCSSARR